jgi:putative PIN family toxin of toxin-antitoxin system
VRLVLDTNVALSGLSWGGPPGKRIDAALEGRIRLVSSIPLIAELQGVLGREKFETQLMRQTLTVRELVDSYAALVEIVRPAAISPTVIRDPDDDQVLAAVVSGSADMIVSGDSDLLDLGYFRGVGIITATAAIALIPGIDLGA